MRRPGLPTTDANADADAIGPATAPPNRRGRPSRRKEREISDAIIQTALHLFLTDGYGATSMKRISEVAGVAPNTLYSRHPDKPALFRAIVRWKVASWQISNPLPRTDDDAPLAVVLEAAARAMLEAMERQDVSAMGRLVSAEAERFPELAIIYRDHAMRLGEPEMLARIVAATRGRLTPGQAEDIHATLTEAVLGHGLLRGLQEAAGGAASKEQAAARIARVIAAGWDRPGAPT